MFNLGWAYEGAGMPKEAIEALERAIARQDPTEDQLWVLPSLAAAYAEVGQIDRRTNEQKVFGSLQGDFSSNARADEEPYEPKDRERYVNALFEQGCRVIPMAIAEQSALGDLLLVSMV